MNEFRGRNRPNAICQILTALLEKLLSLSIYASNQNPVYGLGTYGHLSRLPPRMLLLRQKSILEIFSRLPYPRATAASCRQHRMPSVGYFDHRGKEERNSQVKYVITVFGTDDLDATGPVLLPPPSGIFFAWSYFCTAHCTKMV